MLHNLTACCLFTDTLVDSPQNIGNYYNGCEWAPDGSCLMTSSNDNILRIYDTPLFGDDFIESKVPYQWKPSVTVPHSESIYDAQWYPLMNSTEPSTCFLATTSRDQPIQIIDAYYGKKIQSFLCHNINQCVTSPISLQFTPDGYSLVAGFKKEIRFFDLSSAKAAGQMSTVDGKHSLNSLISTISFDPETFESNPLIACGSYDSRVAIYDYYSGDCIFLFDLKKDINLLEKRNNNSTISNVGCGGATKVLWSKGGNLVTCGTRKCDWIIQYDIRAADTPLTFFRRQINNNQKFAFCFDSQYNSLLSGGTDGNLNVWDTQEAKTVNHPSLQIPLHSGPFTGCALHPFSRLLATASGCRIFDYPGDVFINKQNDRFFLPDARICLWRLDGVR